MKILELLVEYNFKKDYAVKCINANKHNHVTTSYYLLLKRHEQLGDVSDKDFEYFDDKKINALAQQEKLKGSAAPPLTVSPSPMGMYGLNQTMPIKKETNELANKNTLEGPPTEDATNFNLTTAIPATSPNINLREAIMNKTVNVQKDKNMPFSMAEQHNKGVPIARPRGPNIQSDSATGSY